MDELYSKLDAVIAKAQSARDDLLVTVAMMVANLSRNRMLVINAKLAAMESADMDIAAMRGLISARRIAQNAPNAETSDVA